MSTPFFLGLIAFQIFVILALAYIAIVVTEIRNGDRKEKR